MTEQPDEPHPPYVSVYAAYWAEGRMCVDRVYMMPCGCDEPARHEKPAQARVELTLFTGEEDGGQGRPLWRAKAFAPGPEQAEEYAREAAKALAFRLNPLFQE